MKKKIFIVILISLILLTASFVFIGQKVNRQEETVKIPNQIDTINEVSEINSIQGEKLDIEEESAIQEVEQVKPEIKVEEEKQECEFVISCASILDKEIKRQLPKDGIIFSDNIEITEDKSAYDLLKQVTRANKIQIEVSETPLYESVYIEGIDNIYEFDYGTTSGWTYRVNGVAPDIGANKYIVKNGDKIEFIYVTEWQSDIGG